MSPSGFRFYSFAGRMCSVDSVWRRAGAAWAQSCPHLWGVSWKNPAPTADSPTRAPALGKKGRSSAMMGAKHWGGPLHSWTSWIFWGPHPHKDASLLCGLGWAVRGGGSWTRGRTLCPRFPWDCLWCVSAWDPSGSSCFVVTHPPESVALGGFQALFPGELASPCLSSLGRWRMLVACWSAVLDFGSVILEAFLCSPPWRPFLFFGPHILSSIASAFFWACSSAELLKWALCL